MEKTGNGLHRFGLVGRNISYSFSRGYFSKKFEALGLDSHRYENFDIPSIADFESVISNTENLIGLNVTIPYKREVLPFLDALDASAAEIGAVNTIKIRGNHLKGYNTDAYGFQKSLEPFLKTYHKKALILGTGGASKAIAFVLKQLGIQFSFVSRKSKSGDFTYEELSEEIIKEHLLIINCTPLGTFPNIMDKPALPYAYLGPKHLLFDLIYNPEKTEFLRLGEAQGAVILNGLKMLELQAERAWEIWNAKDY
ncbi:MULTISPECIES: shikimate dehydrogenase family protein [Maribacter]|uniref:Shikimate dehydrogenase n=1 Tax=Maribacter flavus TaxID=1658664 RepID=A0A5B2TLW7_9FLAO|nr:MULTISPECIES: shikimate dehydrogenase [Maribacter]KAA2215386.1 shikimate dehydrogenase [Maribacter flavus]MDC6407001.1 shikimate dehydrogenase [Maribacter sp. PR66]MEE1974116.1 shikimate dehydrogenase [Maribacter flavus]